MPSTVQFQTAAQLSKLLRKTASDAQAGFNFMSPEVAVLKKVSEDEIPPSLREMLFPCDINESGGIASIPDFGQLARPSTTGLEEGIGYLIHLNGRFNQSTLARLVAKGTSNQIVDQFKYQSAKKVKAMLRAVALQSWGSSSGVRAVTDSGIAASTLTQTFTLKSAFGVSGQNDPQYLADLFATTDSAGNQGDGVAFILSGAVLATGTVTGKSASAGTITVTFDTAPSANATTGIQIVLNNAIGSALAQTDYNQSIVGWTDAITASSLHSITHPEWAPAVYDTSSVRFSPLLYQKGRDQMSIRGDATVTHLFWDPAVKRDAWDNRASLQRFNDTAMFTLDGDIKAKNVENIVTRNVPTGWVTAFDVDKAVKRVQVTPFPAEDGNAGLSQADGKDYIDQAGRVFEINLVFALQWRNRRATAAWTNKTRS